MELEHEGYDVTAVHDGQAGLEAAQAGGWDLLLLDILMPGMSGLELCRRVRTFSNTPIIMLTAKDDLSDIVAGLDAGADDYQTKPFAFEELLARVRAQLRRGQLGQHGGGPNRHDRQQVADLMLDPASRTATRGDRSISLTKREFDLLRFLMAHAGQVLTRDQLLAEVWSYDYLGETNVVDVYIRYLRNKIDQGEQPRLIHTVRGVGYVIREEQP